MKTYTSPEGFKHALEDRIRKAARERGSDIGRFRQVLVFDRFLARLHRHFGERVVIKGGVVLELRLQEARATNDVDLRLTGSPGDVLAELRTASSIDLGDWLSFEIVEDHHHPVIQGDGIAYDGFRFRAEARLAGRIFGSSFGVDIAFADVLTDEPEVIVSSNFLAFAGVEAAHFRIYPRTTHIAEKMHAYTLPRAHENTRVKDLADLALLALVGPLAIEAVRTAIGATFEFRASHDVPTSLPSPPESWEKPYVRMAITNQLPWQTLDDVTKAASAFIDPILGAERKSSTWAPAKWRWLS